MVLACVLAGVGAARLAEAAGRPAATVAVVVALAFAASPYLDRRLGARGSGVAAAVPQPPVPMRRVAGTVTWSAYEAQNVNELR